MIKQNNHDNPLANQDSVCPTGILYVLTLSHSMIIITRYLHFQKQNIKNQCNDRERYILIDQQRKHLIELYLSIECK